MGWEQRGAYKYYYRKERDGSRVKSVYVGRGEIANMVSDLQTSSGLFEEAISIAYPSELERLREPMRSDLGYADSPSLERLLIQ